MEVETNFNIKNTLAIGVAQGVTPITTNSTTLVTNLNADLLDGLHGSEYQPTLVSGTTIKTVNNTSLLGAGDISVSIDPNTLITVPQLIPLGQTATIDVGRTAILPNTTVAGTLNVNGTLFIPSGTGITQTSVGVTATDSKIATIVSQAGMGTNQTFNLPTVGGTLANLNIGEIIFSPVKPQGTLLCDGSLVLKSTYSNLYNVIGDNFNYIANTYTNAKPWKNQYSFNVVQSADITGWTTDISLPGTLGISQAIVTNSRVYLLGGRNGTAVVSTVYTAPINSDGTLGTWTTGTSLPGVLGYSQAIVTNSRVYLLGGYSGTAAVSTVYTAPINSDGTLGTWTTGTSLPGILDASQAIVTNSRVYLLGGHNGTATVSTVYTAPINSDGTLGTWTTDTSLPGVLCYSQAIVTNSRVYLLGGSNGTTVSTVYTAPINSDGTLGTWTTGTSLP